MRELRGAMPAMVTPFDRDGALNLDLIGPYLDFQRANGVDGVVVAGTNGEGVSMSVEERMRLLEAVIQRRGDFTVFAGTGAANLPDTLTLTRYAASAGVDAVL